MRTTLLSAAILALAAALPLSPVRPVSAADEVPSHTATRTTGTIAVDGKLTEADWANAAEMTMVETVTGNALPRKSTVKVLWDDKFLYVGFQFEDPDAWTPFSNDEDPIWDGEAAEVFIDPEGKGHTYYEYEINPVNKKVDLFVLNQGPKYNGNYTVWMEWNFTTALKRAVFVDGDGKNFGTADKSWSVELAFPFDEMWTAPNIPPKDGDMWRINFYRIEHPTKNNADAWFGAWSTTLNPSYHTPWRFGKVYFKK